MKLSLIEKLEYFVIDLAITVFFVAVATILIWLMRHWLGWEVNETLVIFTAVSITTRPYKKKGTV
jgi:predicted Kef-type K+ transport protein